MLELDNFPDAAQHTPFREIGTEQMRDRPSGVRSNPDLSMKMLGAFLMISLNAEFFRCHYATNRPPLR